MAAQTAQERLFPDRQAFAAVYRLLKSRDGWHHHILALLLVLQGEGLTLAKLLVGVGCHGRKRVNCGENLLGKLPKSRYCQWHRRWDLFDSQILDGLKQAQKRGVKGYG